MCKGKPFFLFVFLTFILFSCADNEDKEYSLTLFATNDVHGSFFTEPYVEGRKSQKSLSNVSYIVNEERKSVKNVMLIDVGDILQGNSSMYYYNYIDNSKKKHLFTRVAEYMKYDALVLGNHDLETGHAVFDRINNELKIPYLAANVFYEGTDKNYFKPYAIIKKNGIKVAVIGMTNPNLIKWISYDLRAGMQFEPIYPLVDSLVRKIKEKENPDITLLAIHAGIGKEGDYDVENPALYVASKVKGIDAVLAAHDHRRFVGYVYNGMDSVLVIEGGAMSRSISKVVIKYKKQSGIISEKTIKGSVIDIDKSITDTKYDDTFSSDFKAVKDFSSAKIGYVTKDIVFSDALNGMSDYINIVQKIKLFSSGADVSITAPLLSEGVIKKGDLIFMNLFDLYRFENQLYVLKMKGSELKRYLEASYKYWIEGKGPIFNYDSAAGIIYEVSLSAEDGHRIRIKSMADGSAFDENKYYSVAVTSYRVNGGGDLLIKAGIGKDEIANRIVHKYNDIRDMLYDYIIENKVIDPDIIAKDEKLGYWNFVK